jgi:hypothetical protein
MSRNRMTKESSNPDKEDNSKGNVDSISEIDESWLVLFKARLVPLGNNGVIAWFLYSLGYSSFMSGNKESSLLALKILKIIDNPLADLLEHRISQPLPQMQKEI